MKKKRSMLIAVLIASAMLVACGGGNTSTSEGSGDTADSVSTNEGSGDTTQGKPQEITFVLSNEPDGIDPSVTSNSFASPMIKNCFEGLVKNNQDNELVPGLAESWDISDDGLVYDFHLRPDLKWSDGTPLTAHDFVYTYKRIL